MSHTDSVAQHVNMSNNTKKKNGNIYLAFPTCDQNLVKQMWRHSRLSQWNISMSPPWKNQDGRDLSALCPSILFLWYFGQQRLSITLHLAHHMTVIAVSQADVEGIDSKLIVESYGDEDEVISNFPTSQNNNPHTVPIVSILCCATFDMSPETSWVKQMDEDTMHARTQPSDSSTQYEVIHKHDRIILNPASRCLITVVCHWWLLRNCLCVGRV